MMNSFDYWHGFQDAVDLIEDHLETVEGKPEAIVHVISKSAKEKKIIEIEKDLEL